MTDQRVEIKDMSAEQANLSEQSRRAQTLEELGLQTEEGRRLTQAIDANIKLYSQVIRDGEGHATGKKFGKSFTLGINPENRLTKADLARVEKFTEDLQDELSRAPQLPQKDREMKAADAVVVLSNFENTLTNVSTFLKHQRKNGTNAAVGVRVLKDQIHDAYTTISNALPKEVGPVGHLVSPRVAKGVAVVTATVVGAGIAYAEQNQPKPRSSEFKIDDITKALALAKVISQPANYKGGDPAVDKNNLQNVDALNPGKIFKGINYPETSNSVTNPLGNKEKAQGAENIDLLQLPWLPLSSEQLDRMQKSYQINGASDFRATSKDVKIPDKWIVQDGQNQMIVLDGSMPIEVDSALGQNLGPLVPFIKKAIDQGAKVNVEYETRIRNGRGETIAFIRIWGLEQGQKIKLNDAQNEKDIIKVGNEALFGSLNNQLWYSDPKEFKGVKKIITRVITITDELKNIIKTIRTKDGKGFNAEVGNLTPAQLDENGRPLILFSNGGSLVLAETEDGQVSSNVPRTNLTPEAPYSGARGKPNPDISGSTEWDKAGVTKEVYLKAYNDSYDKLLDDDQKRITDDPESIKFVYGKGFENADGSLVDVSRISKDELAKGGWKSGIELQINGNPVRIVSNIPGLNIEKGFDKKIFMANLATLGMPILSDNTIEIHDMGDYKVSMKGNTYEKWLDAKGKPLMTLVKPERNSDNTKITHRVYISQSFIDTFDKTMPNGDYRLNYAISATVLDSMLVSVTMNGSVLQKSIASLEANSPFTKVSYSRS